MASFHVGQRVKVVWSRTIPAAVGSEGRIVGHGPGVGPDVVVPDCVYAIVDGFPSQHKSGSWAFLSSQLEPITKPGQETVDWSKSLCTPDGQYNPAGDHIPTMTPEWVSAWGGR